MIDRSTMILAKLVHGDIIYEKISLNLTLSCREQLKIWRESYSCIKKNVFSSQLVVGNIVYSLFIDFFLKRFC